MKPRAPRTCSHCQTQNRSEERINSYPDSKCLDLHPEKIPAHLREKIAARMKAEDEGGIVTEAIINEPSTEGQEELIQRPIGRINPKGVGQITSSIELREEKYKVVQVMRQIVLFEYKAYKSQEAKSAPEGDKT